MIPAATETTSTRDVTTTTSPTAAPTTQSTTEVALTTLEPVAGGGTIKVKAQSVFEIACATNVGTDLYRAVQYAVPPFTIAIDFDEPQIDAGVRDALYSGCNPGTIQSRLRQAEVSGPDVTPAECLDKIRTQPAQSPIPAAKGMTICFETSARQAEKEALTQKIVLMTITNVSSVNNRGKLSFTLTAWNKP